MGKRVAGVTEKLLECAKEEFLLKGYDNASLRVIAKKADSSKGAIYIRYPDKESLYRALVQPTMDELCRFVEKLLEGFSELSVEEQKEQEKIYADDGFCKIVEYIYDNFNEFKLLMACGENKVAQELIHKLVDLDVEHTTKFIKITKNDAFESGRLTPELIHLLSSSFYLGLFEVVLHDMPKEHATKYIKSMRKFYKAGWIHCPVCGKKTRTKVYQDTVLIRYPLYCPKCGHLYIIEVKENKIISLEPDAKTQSR